MQLSPPQAACAGLGILLATALGPREIRGLKTHTWQTGVAGQQLTGLLMGIGALSEQDEGDACGVTPKNDTCGGGQGARSCQSECGQEAGNRKGKGMFEEERAHPTLEKVEQSHGW